MTSIITVMGLDALKDLVVSRVWRIYKSHQEAEQSVREWKIRKSIPVVGWLARRNAGYAVGYIEQKRNQTIVKSVRWFVETKTFEDAVGLLLNKNSKIKRLKRPAAIRPPISKYPKVELL